jgi:hypothetical protein
VAKLTGAVLAATLAVMPAAHGADLTLSCDYPTQGTVGKDWNPAFTKVFVITGSTAYIENGYGERSPYDVKETPTQFILTRTAEAAAKNKDTTDVLETIDRITGKIATYVVFSAIGNSPPRPWTAYGYCHPAKAQF